MSEIHIKNKDCSLNEEEQQRKEDKQLYCNHDHFEFNGKYESYHESDRCYYKYVQCGYIWVGYC